MLYRISRGPVNGYNEGQTPIIYLGSTVQKVAEAGLGYVFSDGHGIMVPLTRFYDDLDDLVRIDWEVVLGKWWNDTNDDPDRCRRRQAEFLAHRFFPWALVDEIGVKGVKMQRRVSDLLKKNRDSTVVNLRASWYY